MRNIDSSAAASASTTLKPATSVSFEYTFGAVPRAGGMVRFRLWAPTARRVRLEIEGRPSMEMAVVEDGYHQLDCLCAPGALYRYRVTPDLAVPDPASRLQNGDVHDASVVVDTGSYDWRHADWRGRPWTEAVIYEVHCGLSGGFRGVEERLPELAGLGITALELMPVADFSGPRGWGYDGVLPYAPDSAYGTPDDLRHLIDAAHGMGIMVFLDVVYNHFGPDGNYLGAYAGDFFRGDVNTPWGPAIDFRQKPVRTFFAENALYWLREYRFDGLRLDAVHAITETDWLPEMARFVRRNIDLGRHVHLVLENDDNAASLLEQGFDAQWNDDAHHVMHHVLTGESQGYYAAYAQDTTEKLARFLAEGFVYQGEASSWRGGRPRGEPSAGLPPASFIFFLQNHDQTGNRAFGERLISLCGKDLTALHAAVALQLLTPQIPMLFMGEEYGATTPFQYFTSYENPELAAAVRDGRRTEFAAFHEFSDPSARQRIPDPNDPETWQNSLLPGDRTSESARHWFEWYTRLLALRRRHITAHLAAARSTGAAVLGDLAVRAGWRLGNGAQWLIYCNLGQEDCPCPELPGMADAAQFISNEHGLEALRKGRLGAACTIAALGTSRDGRAWHA